MAINANQYSLKNVYAKARELFAQSAPQAVRTANEVIQFVNPVTAPVALANKVAQIKLPGGQSYGELSAKTWAAVPQFAAKQTEQTLKNVGLGKIATPAADFTRNLYTPLSASFSTVSKATPDLYSSDLMSRAKASAGFVKGAGQGLAGINPLTYAGIGANQLLPQGAAKRTATGFLRGFTQTDISPETKQQTIQTPLGEFDPLMTAGNMIGFVKNPTNRMLFNTTEKYLSPTFSIAKNGVPKAVSKWIASNGVRGSIEQIILDLPEMPENLTEKEKATWLAQTMATGAVSEIAGQAFFQGTGKILSQGKNIATTRSQALVFDWLKSQQKVAKQAAKKAYKAATYNVEPGWAIKTDDGKILSGFNKDTKEGQNIISGWMRQLSEQGLNPKLEYLDDAAAKQLSGKAPGFIDPSAKVGGEAPKVSDFTDPAVKKWLRIAQENPAKKEMALENLSNMSASTTLGREFGESTESYFARKPSAKIRLDEVDRARAILLNETPIAGAKVAVKQSQVPDIKQVEQSINQSALKERGGSIISIEPSARGGEYWNIKFADGSEVMNTKIPQAVKQIAPIKNEGKMLTPDNPNNNKIISQPTPLEALKTEARKYKSAEEFIQAQPNTWYHGSPSDIKSFEDSFTTPTFLTKDKKYADVYTYAKDSSGKKGNVLEVQYKPENTFDTSNPKDLDIYNNQFLSWIRNISKDKRYVPLKSGEKVPFTTADNLYSFLRGQKSRGNLNYDSILVNEGKLGGDALVPLNASQIKTKSQLLDLYNQATAPKGKLPGYIDLGAKIGGEAPQQPTVKIPTKQSQSATIGQMQSKVENPLKQAFVKAQNTGDIAAMEEAVKAMEADPNMAGEALGHRAFLNRSKSIPSIDIGTKKISASAPPPEGGRANLTGEKLKLTNKQLADIPMTSKQAIQTGGRATVPPPMSNSSKVGKQPKNTNQINKSDLSSGNGVTQYLKSRLYPTEVMPKEIGAAAKEWDSGVKVAQVKANQVNTPLKKIASNLKLSENDQWELMKYAEIDDPIVAKQYAKQRGIESLVERSQPLLESYRAFNDDLYNRASLAGFDLNYIQNHVLHKYQQSPDQIRAILEGVSPKDADKINQIMSGYGLGQRPGFSKKRYIDSYTMAEALGLQPKYRTFGQIAAEMENQLQRAVANRTFMEKLDAAGVISPVGKAPDDFIPLTAPGIPKIGDGTPYAADPKVAPFLETVFGGQKPLKLLKAGADLSSLSQDLSLVSPGYTVNAFTIGQAVKDITSGIGDIATLKPKQGAKKIYGTLRAFVPEPDFDTKHADAIEAMAREGIGYSGDSRYQGDQNAWPKKTWNTLFNDPTFQKYMNQRRVRLFENFKDETGSSKLAAEMVKAYDGMLDDLGRDKNAEATLRLLLFAPRYREAVLGTFANIIKGFSTEFKNPSYQSSRSLGTGILLTLMAYNFLNMELNDGKPMWQNPSGRELELVIPKKRFDPTASEDEYWSIPFMPGFTATPRRILSGGLAIAKGNTNEAIKQFSSLASKPVQAIGQAAANSDYFGREIVDQNSNTPDLVQRAMYVGDQLVTPGFIREPRKYLEGKQSLATTALRSMELPLKEGKFSNEFWNKYYQNKEIVTRLDDLKYKDPQRALDFYNQNKAAIDEYQLMRPYVKQYGIDKEAGQQSVAITDYMSRSAGTAPTDTIIPTAQASGSQSPEVIAMRIELKDPTLTGADVATYYLRDLSLDDSGSKYQNAITEKKVWSRLSDVESRDSLTDSQKAEATAIMLQKAGIDGEDYQYYQVAKQDTNLKTMYAIEELSKLMTAGATQEQIVTWLQQNRYSYRGETILSSGVIDNLVDEGLLTYAEGKALKKLSYAKDKSTGQIKTTGSKSSAKKISLPKPKKISFKRVSLPKVKVVSSSGKKFAAPKIKAVSVKLK